MTIYLLAITAFLRLTATVNAIPPPSAGLSNDLTNIYNIDFQTSNRGGCAAHEVKLRAAYDNMLDVVARANSAVTQLQGNQPDKSDRNAYLQWLRKMQPFKAMFPSDPGDNVGVRVVPPAPKARPEDAYHAYLDAHEDFPNMVTKKYRFRCSDDFLTWIGLDDPNPDDLAGRTLRDTTTRTQYPNGAYVDFSERRGRKLYSGKDMPKVQQPHALCVGNVLAFTDLDRDQIVFCNAGLALTYVTFDDAAANIVVGQGISQYAEGIAATWLHELGHLVLKVTDQTAVNRIGLPKKGEEAYGWEQCYRVRKWRGNKALQNAENYLMFAAAVYWNHYCWGDGISRTAPLASWNPFHSS